MSQSSRFTIEVSDTGFFSPFFRDALEHELRAAREHFLKEQERRIENFWRDISRPNAVAGADDETSIRGYHGIDRSSAHLGAVGGE